jgi:hypothetical protein
MFYSSYPARTALGTAIVFFTLVVFLTWAFGQAKRVDGPSTGESCAEFVARVWSTMSSHQPPTPVEQRDLLLCHDALKERWVRESTETR